MRSGTVLACHPSSSYLEQLGREFAAHGYTLTSSNNCKSMRTAIVREPPEILVSELRLSDGPTLAPIEQLCEISPASRIVIVTDHGSIASAVRCFKLGVAGYYTRRVSAAQIVTARTDSTAIFQASERPIRLDRAVWEYLNRVVDCTGSIAGAAEVLGLDRRSLRRMLSKCAPPP